MCHDRNARISGDFSGIGEIDKQWVGIIPRRRGAFPAANLSTGSDERHQAALAGGYTRVSPRLTVSGVNRRGWPWLCVASDREAGDVHVKR
jgi:hypothetical protein